MSNKIAAIKHVLREINLKTIYFNFKYFPFRQAMRLPVFVSKNVKLAGMGGEITIEGPLKTGKVRIGYKSVGIFDHQRSRSIWEVGGKVVFKGYAIIGHGSKLSVAGGGELVLGDKFVMTAESSIIVQRKKVAFGQDCLISWDVLIMDTDFHKIYDKDGKCINEPEDIIVGDHVWVGCRCLILKGAVIPDNAIIAANSLVNKSLEGENTIFGGQPVKELKSNITWKE